MGIEGFVVDGVTVAAQRRAADPRASAWVSANAGAGKTKVLTDRVVRLLLHGAPPARILCLTFTKAAAANMSIRVFERLGRWVTLDDDALRRELTVLEGEAPDAATLRRARRLFARAVETPGGLKIETLHALCERLLHLVPFEANVPARFAVLDEAQIREMVDRVIDHVLADAAGGRDDLRQALGLVAPEAAGEALRKAIGAAVQCRDVLDHPEGPEARLARLRRAIGADEDVGGVERRMLEDGPGDWARLIAGLRDTGKATDGKRADALALAASLSGPERLTAYLAVFFKDEGAGDPYAASSLGTKSVPAAVKEALLAEQERLTALRDRLRAARAFARTEALFVLAREIHRRVELQKARLGALDFDDLIHKTLDLLQRVDSAWVLYKLDRGVDHVLVDEAQDTNPRQWEILRRITQEFCAGEGAREPGQGLARTRFAVGDPKQSIYSFQGAAPEEFEVTRRAWRQAALGAALPFEDVGLTLSFRSATGVLRGVDAVFAVAEHYRGLSFGDAAVGTVHTTARVKAPGQVELWPVETPSPEDEPDAWTQPVDAVEAGAPALVTARRVAKAVRHWTSRGDEGGRVWRPGEILILVRKRSAAFEGVIRALKAEGVPVAGQDRLDIAAHIAVLDLVAAGRAALLPEDDLTLATALKTPLVALSDDDLVRIAAGRDPSEPLVRALARHAGAGDPAAVRAAAALAQWQDLARAHGPFGFYADLLGPLGGRTALVARLGGEAGDAIDVFLTAAAQAEAGTDAPSLTGFLSRYAPSGGRDAGGHTVKRDLDAARDEVRVMTVHGAKGLEAGLVVLIDGCEVLGRDPVLIPVAVGDGTVPVWSSAKAHDCAEIAAAREALHERAREEHNRLLYVAMTRAADRLVIAPYRGNDRETPGEAWCEMVRRGLVAAFGGVERTEMPYGPSECWREGAAVPAPAATAVPVPAPGALPGWLRRTLPPESEPTPPLRPSGLGAADEPRRSDARSSDPAARRRGVLIHALLEHLPALAPERREGAAAAFLAARAPGLDAGTRAGIAADVLRLLADPALAMLFGDAARAEVTLAGRVAIGGTERPVHGRVDRLAVTPDAVWLVDFKTGRPPAPGAPVPRGQAAQVALYAALLETIYPDRPVHPLLVWTGGPVVRRLSAEERAEALAVLG